MNINELTNKSEEAAELLGLLANASRLRILCELHKGERSVSQLEAVAGLSQSALSQHLAKLRAAKIVSTRREAQAIFYSVTDERAQSILAALYNTFCAPQPAAEQRRRRT